MDQLFVFYSIIYFSCFNNDKPAEIDEALKRRIGAFSKSPALLNRYALDKVDD